MKSNIIILSTIILVNSCVDYALTGPTERDIIAEVSETQITKSCIESTISESTVYVPILWSPDDKIGVFSELDNNIKYVNKTTKSNIDVATFITTTSLKADPVYAYYPYSTDAGNNIESLTGNIPFVQLINVTSGSIPGDYKVGSCKYISSDGLQFKFTHIFSPIRIQIDGIGTDLANDRLLGIDLTVTTKDGTPVPICGNFSFNAVNGTYTPAENASNKVTFDWTAKSSLNEMATAYATLFSNIKAGDIMTFTIRTSAHTATLSVNAKVDFSQNYIYTFPLKLSNYSDRMQIVRRTDIIDNGTFTCATYNVDGMPDLNYVVGSLNSDGPGASGTTNISKMISQSDWDIIGFSEDFNYHSQLVTYLSGYNWSSPNKETLPTSISGVLDNLSNLHWTTDGLSLATRYTYTKEIIDDFDAEAGDLLSGANTCVDKGIRHFDIKIAEGVIVDVIITHMNTYSDDGTAHKTAQHNQLQEIANYICKLVSNKRPIIFMGDTNCRYTRHDFESYFWSIIRKTGLSINDPWVDFYWDGEYPTGPSSLMVGDATGTSDSDIIYSEQKGEVVDKVIYFNHPESNVQITANSYLRDMRYKGFADHIPIVVEFYYEMKSDSSN